jgi:glutamyl endopeptidase
MNQSFQQKYFETFPEYEAESELFEEEQSMPYVTPGAGQEYEVIGVDSRRPVKRSEVQKPPFRYICNLESSGSSICTGTLVGPRTVLTAAHCIQGESPRNLRIIPGRYGTWEPLPATQATTLLPMPGYDIGIIHLRDPIGNQVGYWSRAYARTRIDQTGTSISAAPLPLPAGRLQVNIAGYPGDKPGGRRFGCLGPSPHRLCGTYPYLSYNRTVSSSGGILNYLNDTFPGMSGSPVWVRRDPTMGGRVLIGVHVAGDDPARPGISNRSVRINDQILRFITANTV